MNLDSSHLKNKFTIFLLSVTVLIGCKRVEEPSALGQDFYPLEIGKYRTFEVDSSWFDAFANSKDTVHYFVRETAIDTFRDATGRLSYTIDIEWRSDTNDIWKHKNIATETVTTTAAERVEFNHKMIKLTLPIKERKTWDENAFNTLEEQRNKYLDVESAYIVNGQSFANTVSIEQGDEVDPFFAFIAEEVYAKDIGLIYKSYTKTETQSGVIDGISYTKKLYDTNW